MKIPIDQIKETEKQSAFEQEIADVNEALALTKAVDYQFREPVDVTVRYYRSGADLFFQGRLAGMLAGTCARCLETFPSPFQKDFALVLKPLPVGEARDSEEALGFYRGDEIDLSPLIREEILLSLPTRPLCSESCAGLCPRCGIDRNTATCSCAEGWTDPRFEVLRNVKITTG